MRGKNPLFGFNLKEVSKSISFKYAAPYVSIVEPAPSNETSPSGTRERVGSTGWTEPMSIHNARPNEGNDGTFLASRSFPHVLLI